MAKFVLKDAFVSVNGVTLSDHVASVEVTMGAEDVPDTAMGASGVGRKPGLRDESFAVTWRQDFAAANVDATLAPLYTGGTLHTVEVRPTSAAVSATNPKYSGSCYLNEWSPIAGEVGSIAEATSSHVVDGVITRATV